MTCFKNNRADERVEESRRFRCMRDVADSRVGIYRWISQHSAESGELGDAVGPIGKAHRVSRSMRSWVFTSGLKREARNALRAFSAAWGLRGSAMRDPAFLNDLVRKRRRQRRFATHFFTGTHPNIFGDGHGEHLPAFKKWSYASRTPDVSGVLARHPNAASRLTSSSLRGVPSGWVGSKTMRPLKPTACITV